MRTHRRAVAACLAAAAVALSSAPSRADFLYGVTFLKNELIAVDTTTGVGSLVGPLTGNVAPFGLANSGNRIFTFDSTADVIRQINTATGGTLATFNVGIGPVLGQGGLAFQNANVGFLTSALDPVTLNPANDLYRFDIAAGTSALVGHTAPTLEALAFSPDGKLYGLGKLDGNLYLVNPANAATTLVGNTGVAVGNPTGGLTFGFNGVLYATLDDKLYTLNLATGAATPVGSSDPLDDTGFSSISGLSAVPEPSAVLLLGLGVTAVCVAGRRRR